MSLFKVLFKIVMKGLLALFMATDNTIAPSSNGKYSSTPNRPEDDVVDKTMHRIQQAVHDVEEGLDRKLEKFCEHQTVAGQDQHGALELNDLRAELAELKADIRSLKRMVVESNSTHDNASHH